MKHDSLIDKPTIPAETSSLETFVIYYLEIQLSEMSAKLESTIAPIPSLSTFIKLEMLKIQFDIFLYV